MFDKLLQNFLLGGTVIAITSYLATFMNPVLGAIFWSYPISILPSVYYMKTNGKNNKYIAKFLFSTTFALILLMFTTFAISYYLKNAPEKESIWPSVIKSTMWWVLFSVLYFLFVKYGGYMKHFM